MVRISAGFAASVGSKWRECDFCASEELQGILAGGANNAVFK